MKLLITIFQDEDGMYIAECPAIPGCVSQGHTEAEAEQNMYRIRFSGHKFFLSRQGRVLS